MDHRPFLIARVRCRTRHLVSPPFFGSSLRKVVLSQHPFLLPQTEYRDFIFKISSTVTVERDSAEITGQERGLPSRCWSTRTNSEPFLHVLCDVCDLGPEGGRWGPPRRTTVAQCGLSRVCGRPRLCLWRCTGFVWLSHVKLPVLYLKLSKYKAVIS